MAVAVESASSRQIPLRSLVDAYLDDLARRHKSPHTLTGYRQVLATLPDQWGSLDDLSKASFRAWMDAQTRLGVTTQKWHWAVLRAFCRWLDDEDYPVDQSVFKVRGPQLPKREPETITWPEVHAILQAIWPSQWPLYPKAPAITHRRRGIHQRVMRGTLLVRILYCTGVRVSELVKLTADDIVEGTDTYLRIRQGKGDKDRAVAFPEDGVLVRDLRRFCLEQVPAGMPIFPFTTHGVEAMLRRWGKAAGLQRRVYPHLFRHTFATEYMAGGGSELKLQKALGHTTLQMTSRYTHFNKANVLKGWSMKDPGGKS